MRTNAPAAAAVPLRIHPSQAQPQATTGAGARAVADVAAIAPPLQPAPPTQAVMADDEVTRQRCCSSLPQGTEGDNRLCCMFWMGGTGTLGYSMVNALGFAPTPAWPGYLACGVGGVIVGNLAGRECCDR